MDHFLLAVPTKEATAIYIVIKEDPFPYATQ